MMQTNNNVRSSTATRVFLLGWCLLGGAQASEATESWRTKWHRSATPLTFQVRDGGVCAEVVGASDLCYSPGMSCRYEPIECCGEFRGYAAHAECLAYGTPWVIRMAMIRCDCDFYEPPVARVKAARSSTMSSFLNNFEFGDTGFDMDMTNTQQNTATSTNESSSGSTWSNPGGSGKESTSESDSSHSVEGTTSNIFASWDPSTTSFNGGWNVNSSDNSVVETSTSSEKSETQFGGHSTSSWSSSGSSTASTVNQGSTGSITFQTGVTRRLGQALGM